MPGPVPKDPTLRQRRNRAPTAAHLIVQNPVASVPELPARGGRRRWHALTIAWWEKVWSSPMAGEFLDGDIPRLWLLADLWDQYWRHATTSLAAEIRLQSQCFGLTPIDRRRLQWEVEKVEAVTRKRPIVDPVAKGDGDDPRARLRIVK